MILPALAEATSPYFRQIKYSLFPPLGLATLAAHCSEDDDIELQDEHVERLNLDDRPDLVVIEVYVTSAYRAYEIADRYRAMGVYVCLGGLHVTRDVGAVYVSRGTGTWGPPMRFLSPPEVTIIDIERRV